MARRCFKVVLLFFVLLLAWIAMITITLRLFGNNIAFKLEIKPKLEAMQSCGALRLFSQSDWLKNKHSQGGRLSAQALNESIISLHQFCPFYIQHCPALKPPLFWKLSYNVSQFLSVIHIHPYPWGSRTVQVGGVRESFPVQLNAMKVSFLYGLTLSCIRESCSVLFLSV